MYPDEVNYPGFTWPAQSSWAPKSDERTELIIYSIMTTEIFL